MQFGLQTDVETIAMKIAPLWISLILLAPVPVLAQDTTIIHKETTTVTPVPAPAPDTSVTIRTETDATGSVEDCQIKTVRKEDGMGNSVTKTKTNCP